MCPRSGSLPALGRALPAGPPTAGGPGGAAATEYLKQRAQLWVFIEDVGWESEIGSVVITGRQELVASLGRFAGAEELAGLSIAEIKKWWLAHSVTDSRSLRL